MAGPCFRDIKGVIFAIMNNKVIFFEKFDSDYDVDEYRYTLDDLEVSEKT